MPRSHRFGLVAAFWRNADVRVQLLGICRVGRKLAADSSDVGQGVDLDDVLEDGVDEEVKVAVHCHVVNGELLADLVDKALGFGLSVAV